MIEPPIFRRVCKDYCELDKCMYAMLDLFQIQNDTKFPVELTLTKYKKKRTDQQNRYLFGIVYATISQETGNDVNALHEYYLGSFFGWQESQVFDKIKLVPRERSSKQVKARFSEFIEFVTAHAASFGIVIPPPLTDKTW